MSTIDIAEFREFLLRAKGQAEHIFSGEGKKAQQAIDYLFVVADTELLRQFKARGIQPLNRADPTERDAARYRWLCDNNFDRQRLQVQTWVHTWEPHSVTGEPTEWKARVRGGALDRVIDAEMDADIPRSLVEPTKPW